MPDTYAPSDYAEDPLLAHLLGQSVMALPAVTAAICISSVAENDDGDSIVEPPGTYARLAVSPAGGLEGAGGDMTLSPSLVFAPPSEAYSVAGVALVDAPSGGNVLAYCNLGSVIAAAVDNLIVIGGGQLVLGFTSNSPMTNQCRLKMLRLLLGKSSFSIVQRYIAVTSTTPTRTSTGSSLAEPAAVNGYARLAVAAGDWAVPSFGVSSNANPLVFGPATPGAWFSGGSPAAVAALVDDSVAGSLYVWAPIVVPQSIYINQTLTFDTTKLTIGLR